jgi:hypothetical protein
MAITPRLFCRQRDAVDVRQMVAFDACCRMTRGTRRRHAFSIGARELMNVLRSFERDREQESLEQRLALLVRLQAKKKGPSLQRAEAP